MGSMDESQTQQTDEAHIEAKELVNGDENDDLKWERMYNKYVFLFHHDINLSG
jgi:hypothetical protein